jgi:hypothetical protein
MLTLSGSKYPGETEVDNQANDMCNDKLDSMLKDDDEFPAGTDIYYLTPTRFSWATGDHSLTCLIQLPKDYSRAPAPGLAHGERPDQRRGGAVTGVQVDGSRLHHEPAAVVVEPEVAAVRVRVVLVGTYRLDEARAHPRLRSLVRSLQRLGLAEEMTLTPLSADVSTADRSSQTSDGGRNQHTSRCRRGTGSLSSSATSSLIMTNRFTVGTV